jgi:hypothetical protein
MKNMEQALRRLEMTCMYDMYLHCSHSRVENIRE